MPKLNWKIFEAKFDGKEQDIFEFLIYLLFTKEFNQPNGIQGYYNQAGIEKDPVFVNGQWIGFQAKFYKTKISDNKQDFIESIKTAKNKNPEINKIYFYLNKEFSESSKRGSDSNGTETNDVCLKLLKLHKITSREDYFRVFLIPVTLFFSILLRH